jgi:peptidoglycan/LPS O-acetylase OafA/YrhL
LELNRAELCVVLEAATCLWAVIVASAVGFLATEGHYHDMDTGWAWRNIAGGFPRVGFSFFLGVALARWHVGRKIRLKAPASLYLMVLAAALILPTSGEMFRLLSFAEVAFLFPALVYLGAEAVEVNPRVGSLLGDASYAVYAIHMPLLEFVDWACNGLATDWSVDGALPVLPVLEAIFVLMVVIVALLVDAKYDRPMRRFLLEFSTRVDSNRDRLYGHMQSSGTG